MIIKQYKETIMSQLINRTGFTFYQSYYEVYQMLSDEQKVQFTDAILKHQFTDIDAEDVTFTDTLLNVAWVAIKPNLINNRSKFINGSKAKPKRTRSETEAKPKRKANNVNVNEKDNVNVNVKVKVDAFVPNQASVDAVNTAYPNCSIDDLVIDFIDQATNRKQPFKDLQSGFRNYVRKGWVKPKEQSTKSFAQMATESESPWDENGRLIGLKDDGTFENDNLSLLTDKMRVL